MKTPIEAPFARQWFRSLAAGLSASFALTVAAAAQGEPALPDGVERVGPVVVDFSDRYTFEARNVAQTYLIDVIRIASPLQPPSPDRKLPVLFVTDGNSMSGLASGVAILNSVESLPSMYVVSVSFALDPGLSGSERMFEFSYRRGRDFTPPVGDASLEEMQAGTRAALGRDIPAYGRPGGAAAFLAFLNEELKPFIAARYADADTDDTALLGHSLGGLFVLHTLLTSPDSFDRYIAVSPAAGWDHDALFDLEADAGDINARLFMAVGGDDLPDVLEATERMDAALRASARPSLDYSYQLFPGETHNAVVAGAFIRGLRTVFDPPPPPSLPPEQSESESSKSE